MTHAIRIPPLSRGAQRTEVLRVRLTRKDASGLIAIARDWDTTASSLLACLVHELIDGGGEHIRVVTPELAFACTRAITYLCGASNNLNQLVRAIHSGEMPKNLENVINNTQKSITDLRMVIP